MLERVGRLAQFCLEEAGLFGRTVEEARDSDEREWLLEQERNFVGYCPRELDAIVHAATEFTAALWIECSPDWKEPSQSVSEARTELVSELRIAVAPPDRRFPLEATKRAEVKRRRIEANRFVLVAGTCWRIRPAER